MEAKILGQSHLGLPIMAYDFPYGPRRVLILGGVHGDEVEGVWTAMALLQDLTHRPVQGLNICLVPSLNVDGVLARTRTNARGVDLNRNLPTEDWSPEVRTPRYHPGAYPASEFENQVLMKILDTFGPQLIVSLHSWRPCLNVNGRCEDVAEAFRSVVPYPIESDLGYPTPGCLGTYGAQRLGIPVLTVELERGGGPEKIPAWAKAVSEALQQFAKRAT